MSNRTTSRRAAEPRIPRELLRRDTRNTRLHVPRVDFNDIMVGAKREYRNYGARVFNGLTFPTPAIGYCQKTWWKPENKLEGIDTMLLVLEASWTEPLGAISAESLVGEGFPEDLTGFRRYFAGRYPNGGYRPLANVIVYRVRPMEDEDRDAFAAVLFERMYGRFG